jgi:glycosyltransferase involved in cell wall biosynthesis
VVVSSGPPHSAHIAAWLATRFTDTPWYADLRDPWAGPITDAWRDSMFYRSRLASWLTLSLERLVMRSATRIICNTREFATALGALYPAARIEWVPNAVDRNLLPRVEAEPFTGLGIVHVGTVYGGREFGPVLVAMRAFFDRHPDAASDGTCLRIAGNVEEPHASALRRQVADLHLESHVEFLGMIPRAAALQLVGRSRLALVLAQGQEFQVPAKLYEMVAMGVETAVLAPLYSAASSEAWRLGATAVDPKDTEGLVKLMEQTRCGSVAPRRRPGGETDYQQLAHRVSSLLAASRELAEPASQALSSERGLAT